MATTHEGWRGVPQMDSKEESEKSWVCTSGNVGGRGGGEGGEG